MFDKIKIWFLSYFLKRYIAPDERRPMRYPESRCDIDEPHFVDLYFKRNSDPETQAIEDKIKISVANLKARGRF
jgi:hypothetical protein